MARLDTEQVVPEPTTEEEVAEVGEGTLMAIAVALLGLAGCGPSDPQGPDLTQAYIGGTPVFRGVYEDNDPSKRLMMIIDYNTDVSQFWEWSGTGLRPVDDTNEAYKIGVNYIIYGLTR